MAEREDVYDPSTVEVDRGRMQGLGVGQRDLNRQDDLAAGDDAGSKDAADGDRIQAGPPGKPDKAYDDRDADEVSVTTSAGGAGAG